MPLVQNISQHTPWKPLLLTVEVGVRGFVAISTHQVFLKLGLPGKKVTSLCKKLSTTAAKCSYTIYISVSQFKKLGSQSPASGFALSILIFGICHTHFFMYLFLSHPVILFHVFFFFFGESVKCTNRPWTGQYRQGVLNCVDQGSPQTNGGQGSNWLIFNFYLADNLFRTGYLHHFYQYLISVFLGNRMRF